MNRFARVIILLAAFLLGVAWILESRERVAGAEPVLESAPIAGYAAPDFTLQSTNGETVSLSDFRGTPLVLNFWATWCPPCRAEIPFFQSASQKYNGQVAILGVNDGERPDTVLDFVGDYGMTYPVLLDTGSAVSVRYRVTALPTTVFINADGVIAELFPGIINEAVLEDRIESLIRE
jgi:peroxiredoxin